MIDPHIGHHPMSLKNPINLLFLTPHNIPIITISFFPLSIDQTRIYTIFKWCFKFDCWGMVGKMLFFYVSPEILRHFFVFLHFIYYVIFLFFYLIFLWFWTQFTKYMRWEIIRRVLDKSGNIFDICYMSRYGSNLYKIKYCLMIENTSEIDQNLRQ